MHGRSSDDTLLERLTEWRRALISRRRAARGRAMLNALNEYMLRDVGVAPPPHHPIRRS